MGLYKEDTKKLIERDVQEFKTKQESIREAVSAALEGYPESMIHGVLTSTLSYGFRLSNGNWHPAPNQNRYEVNPGKENE